MKKPLATRSISCSAVDAKRAPCALRWTLLAVFCCHCFAVADANAQTSSALRRRAIAQWGPPRAIDKSKLARQGFRVLDGRHATVVTDLPSTAQVDQLPQLIDAAVPLLAERFILNDDRIDDWRVLAMVLADREKFAAAGLMPKDNEGFRDGLSIGYELWVADQPSDYYRRHLLLHELVHSFMATQLGSCGPGWYMEGMAELLGTHRWDAAAKSLELGVMPVSREATPMWGRSKLINTAVTDSRLLPTAAVMQIDNRQVLDVESYAWVWAFAKFLDAHPRYRERFRDLQNRTVARDFNDRVRKIFDDDWSDLETEWRLFAATVTYNHDIEREAIDFPSVSSQGADAVRRLVTPARVKVSATRGWQCTGLVVEEGETYELKASGRFVVGAEPDGAPWPAEPGGITLDYHGGEPLGKLMAVVDDRPLAPVAGPRPATSAFLHPQPMGLKAQLAPDRTGVLFLRLNDSAGSLHDNRGDATVSLRRLP